MSEAVPAPAARRSVAVTLLGVITLLYGAFYGVIGVMLIVNGAQFLQGFLQAKEEGKAAINQATTNLSSTNQASTSRDVPGTTNPGATNPGMTPEGQLAAQTAETGLTGFAAFIAAFVGVVGTCIALYGLPAMLAGLGVILRAGWGRVLTLVVAVLTALEGLVLLANYQNGWQPVAIGAAMVLYCVLAFVVLLSKSNAAEFARRPAV